MTEVLRVDATHPDDAAMARAAACLRSGGLVAFPTETVYGLGVHALDPAAVARLFEAKQRPADDPLIVHISAFAAVERLAVDVPDTARQLAARFWPGPLTLVLKRSAVVPDAITAGLDSVALRVPAHPVARALIAAAALPVAAPSANLFSRPSPTRAEHVLQDLAGRIDLVVDGGPTSVGIESTVLDLSRGRAVILRPGAVTASMLREILPVDESVPPPPAAGPMPSPGLLAKHYSPRAPLTLYEGAADRVGARLMHDAVEQLTAGRRVGLLLAREDQPLLARTLPPPVAGLHVRYLGGADDAPAVAAALYAALRDLDAVPVDLILARGFDGEGLSRAIADRMRRAAAGRIVSC
jgi:L-threonylcarbamoyladenylate synthase